MSLFPWWCGVFFGFVANVWIDLLVWDRMIVYGRKPELEERRSRSISREASIQMSEKLEGLVVATTAVSEISSPSSSSSSASNSSPTSSSDAVVSPSLPSSASTLSVSP